MTVPTNFRRNSEIPGVLILHHGNHLQKVISRADLAINTPGLCERLLTSLKPEQLRGTSFARR